MGPAWVAVTPPGMDGDLGFFQCVEDLPSGELVAQPRIEALDVAILSVFNGCGSVDGSGRLPDAQEKNPGLRIGGQEKAWAREISP